MNFDWTSKLDERFKYKAAEMQFRMGDDKRIALLPFFSVWGEDFLSIEQQIEIDCTGSEAEEGSFF